MVTSNCRGDIAMNRQDTPYNFQGSKPVGGRRPRCAARRGPSYLAALLCLAALLVPALRSAADVVSCPANPGGGQVAGNACYALKVPEAPLYLMRGAAPNLVITLDNSNTMAWGVNWEPGSMEADRRAVSSATNPLYYNPDTVYLPPLQVNGEPFPSSNFYRAPADFFRDQFCSSCNASKLSGALTGKQCAALCVVPSGWSSPSGETLWQCKRDLSKQFAAVEMEAPNPCRGTYQSGSEWTIEGSYVLDPDWANVIPDSYPGIDDLYDYFGYRSASYWAMMCQNRRLADGRTADHPLPDCPAYYYRVDASADPSCATAPTSTNSGDEWMECLERVVVGSSSDVTYISKATKEKRRAQLTNCPDTGDADVDLKLAKCNFANWYSFYRTRWLTTQTVLTRVVAPLDDSVRVAYQAMEELGLQPNSDFFQKQLLTPFGPFGQVRREWFNNWLFSILNDGGTHLIQSAVRVHNFYSASQPYLKDPQASESTTNPLYACRNNFHLMFTDGAWDPLNVAEGSEPLPAWVGNNDGGENLPATLPQSGGADTFAKSLGITTYPLDGLSTRIYRDDNPPAAAKALEPDTTGGLADVVFYSWITDLRPTDDELVATLINTKSYVDSKTEWFWNPKNDPADWQHVTTYTIGFGVTGRVTPDTATTGNKIGLYKSSEGLTQPDRNLVENGFPDWRLQGDYISPEDRVDDLWHAAINGRGQYFSANEAQALVDGFTEVIKAVSKTAVRSESAAAAPAFNSGSAGSERYVFMSSFETGDWTGDVKAYRVSAGPRLAPCATLSVARGELCEDPNQGQYWWSAADHLDGNAQKGVTPLYWNDRIIVTGTKTAAGVHTGIDLSTCGTTPPSTNPDCRTLLQGTPLSQQVDLVNFLRGDDSKEDKDGQADASTFRARVSLLGDIINGAPIVVGAPYRDYTENGYSGSEDAFLESNADREELVYAGANDGMLHAFQASTGVERFAYVPRPLLGKLHLLAEHGYGSNPAHRAFVDAPPAEGDAWFGGRWKSVVLGGLGMGAQAVYAIHSPDNPGAVQASDIHLWDFTDADDPNLGYVLGRPSIVRVLQSYRGDDTKWVAVFGNGINSSEDDGARAAGCDDAAQDDGTTTCGQAVLFVVDLAVDGAGKVKATPFYTKAGIKDDPKHSGASDNPATAVDESDPKEPNGLAQPTVLGRVLTKSDGAQIADGARVGTFAYAGDLFGNLWRFDLTRLGSGEAQAPTLVFKARTGEGNKPQPITAPVAVAPHPTGLGVIVLFGTGRYLASGDPSDTQVQTFYGIWDRVKTGEGRTDPITVAELQPQYFKKTDIAVNNGATTVSYGRTSTRAPIAWADPSKSGAQPGLSMGWRIDLGVSSSVTDPQTIEQTAAEREQLPDVVGGERVVSAPQVRGGRVVFASLVPETDLCSAGGYGWLNSLSYVSGAALDTTPFDYNRNGTFDTQDLLNNEAGASIRLPQGGILASGAAMPLDDYRNKLLTSDSKGKLVEILESSALQWRVWRQLR